MKLFSGVNRHMERYCPIFRRGQPLGRAMKYKRQYVFTAILALLLSVQDSQAQHAVKRIDSLATALHQDHELSGNILVATNGNIIYRRSLGYADVAQKRPNNDLSSFQLASVSKIFTAVAVLQLKERRLLALDDAVVKYLPDFPFPGITIRHLLSHTSGLADFQMFEAPHRADTAKIFSLADLIPAMKNDARAIRFKPGEKWSYSNSGYGLLALIVANVSGMPFQEYLQKYIFLPSKMRHTYVSTPLIRVTDQHRTKNYDITPYAPALLKNVDSLKRYQIELVTLGGFIGQANIISTTDDLLRFDQTLYTGKLLKPATLREAFTPTRLNNGDYALQGWKNTKAYYGLGWMILCDSTYGKTVFHSGGMSGAVTLFARNITRKQTVIVLDNVTHRGVHAAGINMLSLLNGGEAAADKQSLARRYAETLFEKGSDEAAVRFNELKADTTHYNLDKRELNILGLNLLYDGHHAEALKLNTLLYPASWNVYDSYAEALKICGKNDAAIRMYKKSLTINPGNEGAKRALLQMK